MAYMHQVSASAPLTSLRSDPFLSATRQHGPSSTSWATQSQPTGSFGLAGPGSFTGSFTLPAVTPVPVPMPIHVPASSSRAPASAFNVVTRVSQPLKGFGIGSNIQDQQCAEEDCDPEECGDENRPPSKHEFMICGLVDYRPFLPVVLMSSTLLGAYFMISLQFPILAEIGDSTYPIRCLFLALYIAAVFSMLYCALSDPGQIAKDEDRTGELGSKDPANARLRTSDSDCSPQAYAALPRRAHKTWLYSRPVRRYDHYCRWVTNSIGLLNHREFMVMTTSLTMIGVLGAFLDFVLVVWTSCQGHRWMEAFFLVMHLTYSVILGGLAGPIWRMHVGFVSRNELWKDYNKNIFYIVLDKKTGEKIHVPNLDDDEHNERFDEFQYDSTLNRYDKGAAANCWTFWFKPRWAPDETGDF